jgi:hypothetical protein
VEDFHDLRFAAREVRRMGSRHGVSGGEAKNFALGEYIRAIARLSSRVENVLTIAAGVGGVRHRHGREG